MLVLFSDENFGYGVHIINGLVRTNVKIEKNKIGYSVMDTNDFKDYCPNEELTELSEVRSLWRKKS